MKKIVVAIALLLTVSSFAQSYGEKKNEAHLNVLNIMAFKWIDVSYERLLNEESTAGISFSTGFSKEHSNVFTYDRKYAVTPFYRFYISQVNASGVFGEVFGMINGGDVATVKEKDVTVLKPQKYVKYSDLGFGLGGGYKFVSNMGLTLQAFGGVGRNLFDENAPVIVIRAGVTIGYRF